MNKVEPIDRAQLINDVTLLAFLKDTTDERDRIFNMGYNNALQHVKNLIRSAPTIDVQPARRGEWVVSEYEYLDCSECGESMYTGCNSTKEAMALKDHWKPFCPHCGADMRKVRTDDV